MGKLYFGGPLSATQKILLTGLQPGQVLKKNLLEAMLEARNSVGLNRRFRPAVLVLEEPLDNSTLSLQKDTLQVMKNFTPEVSDIFLVKIDFNAPHLVRIAGALSPHAVANNVTRRPTKKVAP